MLLILTSLFQKTLFFYFSAVNIFSFCKVYNKPICKRFGNVGSAKSLWKLDRIKPKITNENVVKLKFGQSRPRPFESHLNQCDHVGNRSILLTLTGLYLYIITYIFACVPYLPKVTGVWLATLIVSCHIGRKNIQGTDKLSIIKYHI